MKTFDVEPRVAGAVHLGSNKRESTILAGRMSEKGNRDPIYFDASENFVVLEVGKRGSGKSYGMGAMLEGFATGPGSRISTQTRAVPSLSRVFSSRASGASAIRYRKRSTPCSAHCQFRLS